MYTVCVSGSVFLLVLQPETIKNSSCSAFRFGGEFLAACHCKPRLRGILWVKELDRCCNTG